MQQQQPHPTAAAMIHRSDHLMVTRAMERGEVWTQCGEVVPQALHRQARNKPVVRVYLTESGLGLGGGLMLRRGEDRGGGGRQEKRGRAFRLFGVWE